MLPRINVFVRDTLLPVLPLGARIVTYTFRLGDVGVVAPTAVQQVNNEISK